MRTMRSMIMAGALGLWLGPMTEAAAAPADPAKLAAELARLGKRAKALALPPPVLDLGAQDTDIPAVRPCTRPTAAERAALTRQVAAASPGAHDLALRFGCQTAAGTILDVSYDQPVQDRLTGVWRVVRVSAGGITTLAEYTGTSSQYWMEWSNEVSVHTLALTDLDGDGQLDAVISETVHEGGAQRSDVLLSRWLSTTGVRTAIGEVSDEVQPAARQPADARPLVVRIDPYGGAHDDELGRAGYRCVEATGALAICPAVEPARQLDHARKIAGWFAGGHSYGLRDSPVPDRTLLAELLVPLAALGVTPADAARLLPLAAPAAPDVAIAHEVARALTHPAARYHGELEPVHDHRPDRLMALLGDAACPEASRAAARAAVPRLAAWIAAHDAQALIDHGDCKAGADCPWRQAEPPTITASCAAGNQAYYRVGWRYGEPSSSQRLERAGLFHDRAGALALVASETMLGENVPDHCAACGPGPVAELSVAWHRRGASLVAIALGPDDASPRALAVNVDGAAVRIAPLAGKLGWQVFEGPTYTAAVLATDVVRLDQPDNQVAYFHWDAGWKPVATFSIPTPSTPIPTLQGAALWLWLEARKAAANSLVASFDVERWQRDADYRAELQPALVLVGADKASLARAAAAAAAVAPAR